MICSCSDCCVIVAINITQPLSVWSLPLVVWVISIKLSVHAFSIQLWSIITSSGLLWVLLDCIFWSNVGFLVPWQHYWHGQTFCFGQREILEKSVYTHSWPKMIKKTLCRLLLLFSIYLSCYILSNFQKHFFFSVSHCKCITSWLSIRPVWFWRTAVFSQSSMVEIITIIIIL